MFKYGLFKQHIFQIISIFIEFLFPTNCIGCGVGNKLICLSCMKKLTPHPEICPSCHNQSTNGRFCIKCKSQFPDLEGIMIAFNHNGMIKKLILALKYYHKYDLSKWLAERLALLCTCNSFLGAQLNTTLITSVSSHRYRHYFVKGYNQSELLAQSVANILGIAYVKLVHKTKHTKSQASLQRKQRLLNIRNAFELIPNILDLSKYNQIIIVDDIATTGTTLHEAAKCIKARYPHIKIRAAVVARSNG